MTDIDQRKQPGLLRIVACGSAGDGKSTLVDLLLSESKRLSATSAATIQRDLTARDSQGERGTSIDVPWLFLTIANRNFGVADTRGDERYTSNVAMAAVTAELALILIDARKGMLLETRRHSRIASMFGIRQVVVPINKMDLIGWDAERYRIIEQEYRAFAEELGFERIQFIPISALNGDNVAVTSDNSPWYRGPALMELMETVEIPDEPPASFPAEVADQFEARLVWMSPRPLIPERQYGASLHTQQAAATVTRIKRRIDIKSGQHLAANSLTSNEIADVNLSFDRPVTFEPHSRNRTLGTFVLEDRRTKDVLAIGTLHFALRRATNVHWQEIDISPRARAEIKSQVARCFWLTGLPSSGKSTIANLTEKRLHAAGKHTTILDGDNVRHGLNRDLGFTEADRVENIRRVAEVARLMVDSGLIVIVSFISPFKAEREFARSLFKEGEFAEVFVDTALATCEQRDPKGLYAKARSGALKNFTGYDSPYEAPEQPEVWLRTAECSAIEAAERLAMIALTEKL